MSLLTRIFGEPVPTLSALELQEKLKSTEPPFILDVRQPEEYNLGHIAGTKLIPLGELSKRMNEVPRDREIVCICATGHRSVPAARKLMEAGYSVHHMKNGMIAWLVAELPVKRRSEN